MSGGGSFRLREVSRDGGPRDCTRRGSELVELAVQSVSRVCLFVKEAKASSDLVTEISFAFKLRCGVPQRAGRRDDPSRSFKYSR